MKNTNKLEDLVSVVVISYNSARTILETLNSIKNQTFSNLELIISDDCSIDNTLEICKSWISENNKRFINIDLITSINNLGIPSNCNRGIKATTSNYIKLIAADDLLNEKAIDVFYGVAKHSNSSFFISNMKLYHDSFDDDRNIVIKPYFVETLKSKNAQKQFDKLLIDFFGCAPSFFFKKQQFIELDYFDESIPYMEDYPFALKATKAGYNYEYIDEVLVNYRISNNSISGSIPKGKLFNDFYKKKHIISKKIRYPYVDIKILFCDYIDYYSHYLIDYLKLNRDNFIGRLTYYIFLKINFFRFFKRIK